MKKVKTVLGIYIEPDLRESLEEIAKEENRSLSNQVVQLLNEALAARKGGGK